MDAASSDFRFGRWDRTRILEFGQTDAHPRIDAVLEQHVAMRLRKRSLTASHFFELVGVAVDGHARVCERHTLGLPHNRHPQQVDVIGKEMILSQGKYQGARSEVVLARFRPCVHRSREKRKVFFNPLVPRGIGFCLFGICRIIRGGGGHRSQNQQMSKGRGHWDGF